MQISPTLSGIIIVSLNSCFSFRFLDLKWTQSILYNSPTTLVCCQSLVFPTSSVITVLHPNTTGQNVLLCCSRRYPYLPHGGFFGLTPSPPLWKFQFSFILSFHSMGEGILLFTGTTQLIFNNILMCI